MLLTDDKRNRELAQAEGLVAVSTRDYVDGLLPDERERLVDLVVGGVDETEPSERRARRIYDDVSAVRFWLCQAQRLMYSICLKMCLQPESRTADSSKATLMQISTTTLR